MREMKIVTIGPVRSAADVDECLRNELYDTDLPPVLREQLLELRGFIGECEALGAGVEVTVRLEYNI
jgi:hypothetical protein